MWECCWWWHHWWRLLHLNTPDTCRSKTRKRFRFRHIGFCRICFSQKPKHWKVQGPWVKGHDTTPTERFRNLQHIEYCMPMIVLGHAVVNIVCNFACVRSCWWFIGGAILNTVDVNATPDRQVDDCLHNNAVLHRISCPRCCRDGSDVQVWCSTGCLNLRNFRVFIKRGLLKSKFY